jgi:adenine-specific DNA-methyltransferase
LSKRDYSSWTKDELLAELQHNLSKKKFGLVWEDQPEDESSSLASQIPTAKEIASKKVLASPDSKTNLLIEGDNLHSLSLLNYTHNERIDAIYIDPPYNTGEKDFNYNDQFIRKDDTYRHSKWLSFINRRLVLARNLLAPDGVIFVSIGNDEVHRLRLVMEELFGESNYLATITRVQKAGSDQGTHFAPSVDYVLVFAKNKELLSPFSQTVTEEYEAGFKLVDQESGVRYKEKGLFQASLDPMRGCVNQRYYIEAPDGSLCIPPGNVFPSEAEDGAKTPPQSKQDKVWRWSRDRYLQEKPNLIFKKTKTSPLVDQFGNQSEWNVYTKQFLNSEKGALPRDFMDKYDNSQGTIAVKQLGLEFSFAKPVWMIADLLAMTNKTNALVLDFFAGSGTTGQAVLQLNRLDGGNRSFILCTNNEGNIAEEICHPRIERVITGYKAEKYDEFIGIPANLRYFKIGSVSNATTDANKKKLTKEAVGLLCIRENAFDKKTDTDHLKVFENADGRLAILLDEFALEELLSEIQSNPSKKYKVYAFSLSNDDLSEELSEFGSRVESLPVPEGILNTYFRNLDEIKRRS